MCIKFSLSELMFHLGGGNNLLNKFNMSNEMVDTKGSVG